MVVEDEETEYYDENDWQKYRKEKISFIHQNYNLIENYTVYQNIELAYLLNNNVEEKDKIKNDIYDIISKVELTAQSNQKVATLSGGQKQRVAIARALAKKTSIILADEPTGNLDSENSNCIIELLKNISIDKLVIVVTHNISDFNNYITREIRLLDGKIDYDSKSKNTNVEVNNKKNNSIQSTSSIYISLFKKSILNNRKANGIFVLTTTIVLLMIFLIYSILFQMNKPLYNLPSSTPIFGFTTNKKITVVKKDKTPFSEDDLNDIKSISEIDYINLYDALTSYTLVIPIKYGSYKDFLNCSFGIIDENINLSVGRMPQSNEEVILSTDEGKALTCDNLINEQWVSYYFQDVDYKSEGLKVVGYTKSDNERDCTVYFTLGAAKQLQKKYTDQYGTITLTNNDNIYIKDKLSILIDENILDNEIYTSNSVYMNLGENTNNFDIIFSTNLYENKLTNYTIKNLQNSELTRFSSVATDGKVIVVNESTLDKLIGEDIYQISTFLKNPDDYKIAIEKLETNFNAYYPYAINLVDKDAENLAKTTSSTLWSIFMGIILLTFSLLLIKNNYNNKNKNNAILLSLGYDYKIIKKCDIMEITYLLLKSLTINIIFILIAKKLKSSVPQFLKSFVPLANLTISPIIILSFLFIAFYFFFTNIIINKKKNKTLIQTINKGDI